MLGVQEAAMKARDALGTLGGANYATGAVAGSMQAQERRLDTLLTQMEQQLSAIAEGVQRIQNFKQRVANPQPEGVEKNPTNAPAPSCVEGRFGFLVHAASVISERLHHVASDLDSLA